VLYHPDDGVVDEEETLRVVGGMTGTDPVVEVVTQTSDRARHVLAGDIVSPASNDEVRDAVLSFLRSRGVVTGR
jgi:hypothetical protein